MPNIKEFIKKIGSESVSLEEQQQALVEIEQTIKAARQKREEEVGKNAKMVVDALKQIESRLNDKFQELLATPAMVGAPGRDGKDGKDGKDGLPGPAGLNGAQGKDGIDGVDGKDGVSVVDAKIDFDGSLVITLSNGDEIDAGLVVPTAVAEQYNAFMTRGDIIPTQSGNSGKYLTTDGSNLAWDQINISTADITGTLPIANGGTGATTAPNARTNLGLGTIATQNANSVTVTGGSIDGTTIGGSTPAAGTFTTLALDAPTTDATLTIDTGITGWVYSGKTVSVVGQENNPQGLFIGSNGTKMYVCGSTGDDVNEYTLGTAWDVSTATFTAVSTGVTQDTTPVDVFFKDDGLTMFMLGQTNDTVYQYTLSVAWDITTATYASKSFSVTTQDSAPTGMWFKPDGTTMYIVGATNDTVYQYTLSTPWDISTASYASISFSVASVESNPQQVNLSADGTKMWVLGSTGDDINEYTLGTAWNISTATRVNNIYVGFQETGPTGLFIDSTAANRVYVVGLTTDAVYQYNTVTNTIDATTDRFYVSGEGYIEGNTYYDNNVYVDGAVTANGSLTAASSINFSTAGSNISIGTGLTTGVLTLGGTAQTSAITVGQSTGAQTLNLGTGATTNGTTKAVNIGTAGVSGSTTTINIGSAVSGALGNISMGNSGTQFLVAPTTSAVNYVQVTGNATTSRPVISAQGSDANIGLQLASKGNRSISLLTNSVTSLDVLSPASGVNYISVTGSITGVSPIVSATGTDTNIDLNLTTKGTGAVRLNTGGGEQVRIIDAASAVSYWQMSGADINNAPSMTVNSSNANVGLWFFSRGTGAIRFGSNGAISNEQFRVAHIASAVNYVQVTGNATTGYPQLSAQGSDTNPGILYTTKGTGEHRFSTASSVTAIQFRVRHINAPANYCAVIGAPAGSTPEFQTLGTDTNIDLALTPKGTGLVRFGTHTATALTISGYIEIKDAGGTIRKLAVVT